MPMLSPLIANADVGIDLELEQIENVNSQLMTVTSEDDYNIIAYNVEEKTIDYIKYINSGTALNSRGLDEEVRYVEGYTPLESSTNNLSRAVTDTTTERTKVENTSQFPYRTIGCLRTTFLEIPYENGELNLGGIGTAFVQGPNIMVTAAHCIWSDVTSGRYNDGVSNPRFPNEVYVEPATYKDSDKTQIYPYGQINVTRVYFPREYYETLSSNFDWAICVLEEDLGYQTGWLGRTANYTLTDHDATVVGYPGELQGDMYTADGKILSTSTYRYEHNIETSSGQSGSPIIIVSSGNTYICGIHTTGADPEYNVMYNGGTRFNSYIFDFLGAIQPNDGVEFKSFYYEGSQYNRYNCVTQMIVSAPENITIQLSSDGTTFRPVTADYMTEFFTTASDSYFAVIPYSHYITYNAVTNEFSSVKSIADSFTQNERTALYPTYKRSSVSSVIATSFDQSGNVWSHGGSSSDVIKGTIVYNGFAKNISVDIPWVGTNKSSSVEVGGATFQLRAGPNKVSIKANTAITCNERTAFFAFAVV